MKVLSKRTITYSDNAPLEHSHLAAAFTIINTSGYNILSGLGSEGFRGARKLIIELVLYTDLAKHFEFISRLQGIAADDREARAAARNSKRQSLTISPEIAGAIGSRRGSAFADSRRGSAFAELPSMSRRGSATERRTSLQLPMMRPPRKSLETDALPSQGTRRGSAEFPNRRKSHTDDRRRSATPTIGMSDSSSSTPARDLRPGGGDEEMEEVTTRGADDSPEQQRDSQGPSLFTAARPSPNSRRASSTSRRASFNLEAVAAHDPTNSWSSPLLDKEKVKTETLLIMAIKFADLGHSVKPWPLHVQWSERVTEEFWLLGDKEKGMGVAVGPLCNRDKDNNIPKSQGGFFQFICKPFFSVVAELIDQRAHFILQLEANDLGWKRLNSEAFSRRASEKEAEETSKELASIDSSSKPSAAAPSAQPRLPTSLPPLESRPRPGSPLPTINATPDASFKESFNKEKNERRTSDVSSHLDTCSTASANETERSPVVTEMRVLPPVDK